MFVSNQYRQFILIYLPKLPAQPLVVNDRTPSVWNADDVNAFAPPSPRPARIAIRLRQIVAEIKTRAAASD